MRPVRKIAPHGAALHALRALIVAGHVGTVQGFRVALGAEERTTRTALKALLQAGEAKHLRDTTYTAPSVSRTLSAAVYGPENAAPGAPMTLQGQA